MPPAVPVPAKSAHCARPLTEALVCGSCKTAGYCACQSADWPVHKFGCSPLPASLEMVEIKHTEELCAQEYKVYRAISAARASLRRAGLAPRSPGEDGGRQAEPTLNVAALTPTQKLQAFITPEFKALAALRLSPEFDYPTYAGHKATTKYDMIHQLVVLTRITLLHALAEMFLHEKLHTLTFLEPDGELQPRVRRSLTEPGQPDDIRIRFERMVLGGSAELVPSKVFAAPGRLSRDEYLSLPRIFAYADAKRNGVVDGRLQSGIGVRWSMLAAVMWEVDKNELLQEYDCAQA